MTRLWEFARNTFWIVMVLVLLLVTLAMSAEIVLQYRAALRKSRLPVTQIGTLDRSYDPFTVQYLHPHYYFFFPLNPDERVALNNAVVSIDRDGFREPGPAHAGGRKLAVLIGGSAAFGHYASSNDTTITAYLNRMQDEYFFVSAGVPSWNSWQELLRLQLQIVDLKPALVIAYDGSNDAGLSAKHSPRTGLPYPPATPESFPDLERWVEDIRAERWVLRVPPLFPELSYRIRLWLGREDEDADAASGPIPDAIVAAAAKAYRANEQRMSQIVRASGGRFISVFQPVASMHRNVPPEFREDGEGEIGRHFHQFVIDAGPFDYEFHDLSQFFDSRLPVVSVGEPDGATPPIFVDDVHLFDTGNAMIAEQLLTLIRTGQTK